MIPDQCATGIDGKMQKQEIGPVKKKPREEWLTRSQKAIILSILAVVFALQFLLLTR